MSDTAKASEQMQSIFDRLARWAEDVERQKWAAIYAAIHAQHTPEVK